jgi:hypothetical protein
MQYLHHFGGLRREQRPSLQLLARHDGQFEVGHRPFRPVRPAVRQRLSAQPVEPAQRQRQSFRFNERRFVRQPAHGHVAGTGSRWIEQPPGADELDLARQGAHGHVAGAGSRRIEQPSAADELDLARQGAHGHVAGAGSRRIELPSGADKFSRVRQHNVQAGSIDRRQPVHIRARQPHRLDASLRVHAIDIRRSARFARLGLPSGSDGWVVRP